MNTRKIGEMLEQMNNYKILINNFMLIPSLRGKPQVTEVQMKIRILKRVIEVIPFFSPLKRTDMEIGPRFSFWINKTLQECK